MNAPLPPAEETTHTPLTGAIFWIAICFSSYQLGMASFHPLSSLVIRAIHVGFVLLMIFALYPPMGGRTLFWRALGWVLGLTGFAFGLYQWVFEADLTQRAGDLTTADWVVGVVTVALVFEAARRAGASGLWAGPNCQHPGLWHGRHLWHAHVCVVHLHFSVYSVWLVPGTSRHDQTVH